PISLPIHDVVSVGPGGEKFRNQLGRILQIRIDDDDGVALGVIEPRRQRDLLAEVAAEIDDRDSGIRILQAMEDIQGIVRAAVVDIEHLEIDHDRIEYGAKPLMKRRQDLPLVVSGNNDGKESLA